MYTKSFKKVLAVQVAKLYFLEKKTKTQIAEILQISRFKVASLIDYSLSEGLVSFVINDTLDMDLNLSEKIRIKYNADSVVVLAKELSREDMINDNIAKLASSYLLDILHDNMKVGISYGKVLQKTIKELSHHHLPILNIYQIAGIKPGMNLEENSIGLVHKLALSCKGKAMTINYPYWFYKIEMLEQIKSDPWIKKISSEYNELDLLITGIGSWEDLTASGLYELLPKEWTDDLLQKNIVADYCNTLIDVNGKEIDNPLMQYGFGITTEQISKVPKIIAIAGGEKKHNAIFTLLKHKLIKILITDFYTAEFLLKTKK